MFYVPVTLNINISIIFTKDHPAFNTDYKILKNKVQQQARLVMVMGSGRSSVVERRKPYFGGKMVQIWWHAKERSISNLEGLLAEVIPFLHRYLFLFAVMSRNS